MAAGHLVSGITQLTQTYLKKDFEYERSFLSPLMKDALHERVPKKSGGYKFAWHYWPDPRMPQKQSYGNDLTTGDTLTVTQSVGQLRLMADFVSIDPFGDDVRIDSVYDAASRRFKKQVYMGGAERLRGAAVVGSGFFDTAAGFDASGSESWTTPTKVYAGGATTKATLVGLGEGGRAKAGDLHDLALRLAMAGVPRFPDGTYHLALSHLTMHSLIAKDEAFRQLHEGGKLAVFEDGNLPKWGSFSLRLNDLPWRELTSSDESTGSAYNFSGTGSVVYDIAYGPGFLGDVLLGKGGFSPDFKEQDISKVPNSDMTLGWSLPYGAGIVKSAHGLIYVSRGDDVIAAANPGL